MAIWIKFVKKLLLPSKLLMKQNLLPLLLSKLLTKLSNLLLMQTPRSTAPSKSLCTSKICA